MKKQIMVVISFGLILGLTPSSQAAAKAFKNCTELNKVYPGGITKSSTALVRPIRAF